MRKLTNRFWRTIAEIALLVISYFILISIFAGSKDWQKIDHIYTCIFLFTIVISLVVNLRILIPFLLIQKRYSAYMLMMIVTLVGCTFFNQLVFEKLIDYVLHGYYFISYYEFIDLLKFFLVFNIAATLIHLSWEWFALQDTREKVILLEKEKINADYRALVNQLNPHFLFNSLTVLYSLALNNARETAGAVLKLSDILRYTLYDSEKTVVPILSEVELIENYIELQRYRIPVHSKISFNKIIDDEEIPVLPMLFLPLVENSFKHGLMDNTSNSYITMQLKASKNEIDFVIINSKDPETKISSNRIGGIGLKNIRERLRLMYGDNASLNIDDRKESFSVHLVIKEIL